MESKYTILLPRCCSFVESILTLSSYFIVVAVAPAIRLGHMVDADAVVALDLHLTVLAIAHRLPSSVPRSVMRVPFSAYNYRSEYVPVI